MYLIPRVFAVLVVLFEANPVFCQLDLVLDPTNPTVKEDAGSDVTVVKVTATEGTVPYSYTLVDQIPATPVLFTLTPSNNVAEITTTTENFDFETTKQYSLVVTATDAGTNGDQKTGSVTITVAVTGNIAPAFSQEQYTACVNRNSSSGTQVAVITATDEDNNDIIHSITGGNTDSTFFVTETTGNITVAVGKTISGIPTAYDLIYTATDNGSPAKSASTTVSVTVGNPCVNSDNGGNAGAVIGSMPILIGLMFVLKFLL